MSNYKEYFYDLESYIIKKYNVTISLSYNTQDAWFPKLKLIMINKDNQWRERYFSLLHESGHVILDMGSMATKYMKMESGVKELTRSKKDLVNTLNEEILAWNLGKSLSFEMFHDIDIDKYNETKTGCIMSYIKSGLKDVYKCNIDVDIIKP
jgi:hypothetical protein